MRPMGTKMAADGKPIQDRSKAMKSQIDKSKGDEQQRQATLNGSQPGDVKGSDSRMSGMVSIRKPSQK